MRTLFKYLENLFIDNKKLLAFTYFKKYDFHYYVRFSFYVSLILGLLGFFSMLFIFIFLFRYLDLVLFLLAVLFGFVVFYISIFYFYIYPILAREDYKKDIENNLPFLAMYLYTYASSSINLIDIFRQLAKREDLGSLAKEIRYLVNLVDILGYDFLNALLVLANRTPSYSFKEFLYGLYSVIKSGGSLVDFIRQFARNAIKDYEIKLRSYNEKVNTLITLYSFIFVLFPLSILLISFIIAYIYNNPAIMNQLYFFFFIILPLSYIAYLYLIEIIQPKIQ